LSEDRLRHLVYRCKSCNEFLTKLEIIASWEAAEASGESKVAICSCGGRNISPGNITEKELKDGKYESLWQRFRYRVLGKDDKATRVWKLYYKCVKDKDLGELYKEG